MNLGDPELELVDPTPNVHNLFIHFDKLFFWSKLASRAVVRWSKRMYSCAGTCSYEGRGGLCDIALSEPLLKLRQRKDLVETLLHEMIHAFLFVTCRDQDRDGHGPNFKSHMFRINKMAGLNITIYHDFHDEVKLYRTHWWRCNGPCQNRRPYFGIVRRTMNKPPGPSDYWWRSHQKLCGGAFIKIKEPDKTRTKKPSRSNGDITKYINNNKSKDVKNKNMPIQTKKGVLKDSNNAEIVIGFIKNDKIDYDVAIKKENIFNQVDNKKLAPTLNYNGKVEGDRRRTQSADVAETVRNVWINKQLPGMEKCKSNNRNINNTRHSAIGDITKPVKHKAIDTTSGSPPNKIMKIDNYFKKIATNVLKDIYGEDFQLSKSKTNNKLIAAKVNFVDCPICSVKVKDDEINTHLDECLNRGVIEKLRDSNDIVELKPSVIISDNLDKVKLKKTSTTVSKKVLIKNVASQSSHTNSEIKIEDNNVGGVFIDTSLNKKKTTSGADKSAYSVKGTELKTINALTSHRGFDDRGVNVKLISNDMDFVDSMVNDGQIDFGTARDSMLQTKKVEPGTSKDTCTGPTRQCPCCGKRIELTLEEHLYGCLAFYAGDSATPPAGDAHVATLNDCDAFDESSKLNATGTRDPCPCCLEMIERTEMNDHLDVCLST